MRKQQITAILLSAIMTISACVPAGGISAFAAETDEHGAAGNAAVEETAEDAVQDAVSDTTEDTGADEEGSETVDESAVSRDPLTDDGSEETVSEEAEQDETEEETAVTEDAPAQEEETSDEDLSDGGEEEAPAEDSAVTEQEEGVSSDTEEADDVSEDEVSAEGSGTDTEDDAVDAGTADQDSDDRQAAETGETAADEEISAEAGTEPAKAVKGVRSGKTETKTYKPDSTGDPSSDELFSYFVDDAFGIQGDGADLKPKKVVGERLTGMEYAIYSYIANQLPAIAEGTAGDPASTAFEIPLEELGQTTWTAAELGVDSIFVLDENGDFATDENGYVIYTEEATAAFFEKVNFELGPIVDALLVDYPYELYWYDKTKGVTTGEEGFTYSGGISSNPEDCTIGLKDPIHVYFAVAGDYAAGEYEVDASIGQSVVQAAYNAQEIVSDYSGASDYHKLNGYRQAICDRVAYNHEAVDNNWDYGNPWQLIWVFDNDPGTDVVCEGYSKAFKYLCDQTTFDNDIDCLIVTGTMSGGTGAGPHMWNMVRMEDGRNYLVDVTNCDEGTVGEDDYLFLTYSPYFTINEDSGRMVGYSIHLNGGNINYVYDDDTLATYSDDEIEISTASYDPQGGYEGSLIAERVGEYSTPHEIGESFTLEVTAQSLEGRTISYQWYADYELLEGETSSTLTRTMEKRTDYYCSVTDGEEFQYIYFEVFVENGLRVWPEGAEGDKTSVEITGQLGDEVELQVNAYANTGSLQYEWFDGDGESIETASTNLLTVTIDGSVFYTCTVTDIYGNNVTVEFQVKVDAGFTAYPDGMEPEDDYKEIRAAVGDTVVLKVNASVNSGELYYMWRNVQGDEVGTTATRNVFRVHAEESTTYTCLVSDDYDDDKEITFSITVVEQRLDESQCTLSNDTFTYNGKTQIPEVSVKSSDGTTELTLGEDYHVLESSEESVNAGNYSIKIEGCGDYAGEVTLPYSIVPAALDSGWFSLSETTLIQNGEEPLRPEVLVNTPDGMQELVSGTDYQVAYPEESVNAGTYTITVTGLGNYTGEVNLSYSITEPTPVQTELDSDWFSLSETALTWNGEGNRRPDVLTTTPDGMQELIPGTDYKVTYPEESVNTGTYTITVTGLGNYIGEIELTYSIVPAALNSEWFSLSETTLTQNGEENLRPEVLVTTPNGMQELVSGTDYQVTYPEESVNAGTYTITVTGLGNYTGEVNLSYNITEPTPVQTELERGWFSLSRTSLIQNGDANQRPEVRVAEGAPALAEGVDYEVTAEAENVDDHGVGTYKLTVRGKGNYTGEIEFTYEITPAPAEGEIIAYPDGTEGTDAGEQEIEKEPGAPVELVVNAASGDGELTYAWYVHDEETGEDTLVTTENAEELGVEISTSDPGVLKTSANQAKTYRCVVTSDGKSKEVTYKVGVANGFVAAPKDTDPVEITDQNSTATLVVDASADNGELTYQWTDADGNVIAGQTTSTLTATESGTYYCTVTDQYNNKKTVTFNVTSATDPGTNPGTDPGTTPGTTPGGTSGGTGLVRAEAVTVTAGSNLVYNGKEQKPVIKAVYNGKTLTNGTDYTIAYKEASHVNAGTYKAALTFKGKYTGTKEVSFTIAKAKQAISGKTSALVAGQTKLFAITGAKGKLICTINKPAVATVSGSGRNLVVNAASVGTAAVTVKAAATANYNASAAIKLNISVLPAATELVTAENQAKGILLTWKAVKGANGYIVYRNGAVVATIQGGTTVKYVDKGANTNGAKYTFKVAAKAANGTSPLSTSIDTYKVARPKISSVKNTASKRATVKWKKNSKATGYEIQYSLDKKFKSGIKKATIKKKATVSKVIKSLKKGKTYYFRVQTYKKVGKDTYRSAWSAVKKLKIKK